MTESPQQLNSLDCWDYTIELECLKGIEDLQLAAELGKTLLERNKELENTLKQYQNVIDDQSQEIEYLTKQTVALREVNDSRLRIYEQLEVSIQDLERANHRLSVENTTDKKQIKALTTQINGLESKCDELQSTVDELRIEIESYKRKVQKAETSSHKQKEQTKTTNNNVNKNNNNNIKSNVNDSLADATLTSHKNQDECDSTVNVSDSNDVKMQNTSTNTSMKECANCNENNVEEIAQLLSQLRETRSQISRDQRRITELQEQIETYVQRTQNLEKELLNFRKEDEAKNMQEELITLEEVRQGQLCSRCLRTIESPKTDDMSSLACDEPEEDDSMMEVLCNQSEYRSSFAMDVQDYPKTPPRNLYKEFVEKYEALVEISCNSNLKHNNKIDNNCTSLHDELRMSHEFNNPTVKDTDEESGHGDSLKIEKNIVKKHGKILAQTPTDFSEAETSSSGFSDETSNKATQTDGPPGSFLCTIVDGAESISIYDDASPIESRFRNRPEYRALFKEIFTVLKKAAVNKDENEELPALDDNKPVASTPKVPPVTPSMEAFPDFPDSLADDTQSVLSSTISELSLSHFDPPTLVEDTVIVKDTTENEGDENAKESKEPERVLKPYIRQPLEYISVAVRKRSSSRKKRQFTDRSDSPVTHIVGSPKITYSNRPSSGRRRRDIKNAQNETENTTWNGNTLQFWSSNKNNPASPSTPKETCKYENGLEYKPSAASQDLHKLKRLDLSYAEVLRCADAKKNEQNRYRRK